MFCTSFVVRCRVTLAVINYRNFTSHRNKPVRVRFAPSPTGFLHLGGLRTALYNYLFALSSRGQMILRIEDTDQSRKVPGAMEALVRDLEWAGIDCHEGPTQGGKFGPYIQSERVALYREHAERLLSGGSAYRCFCSDKRLDLIRREAVRLQQTPKYDNKCRSLSAAETKEKLGANTPYCVRFKLTSDCQCYDDLIFGSVAFDVSLVEPDPVILKSDGMPTYHFANIIDDHFMDITHVLRGVEWQISTTKHILLYKAFGWTPPLYGHLPLIQNSDGTKLSKRQNDIKVEDYRKKKIPPLALINFLTLAGGGFGHVSGEGVQINTIQELVDKFDLAKVNSHPSKLNPELFLECQRLELKRLIGETDSLMNMVEEVRGMVREKFLGKELDISTDHIKQILNWSSGRISSVNDLISPELSFLWVLPSKVNMSDESTDNLLLLLAMEIEEKLDGLDMADIKSMLYNFCTVNEIKFSKFMKVVRSALSGLDEGPSVAEMIKVLGKQEAVQRITKYTKWKKMLNVKCE